MASSWGRTGPGPRLTEGAVGRDLRVGSKPEHTASGSLELRLRLTPTRDKRVSLKDTFDVSAAVPKSAELRRSRIFKLRLQCRHLNRSSTK